MLDHIGVAVSDYARSKRFYETALAPLTIALVMEVAADQTDHGSAAAGFGAAGKPFFWISSHAASPVGVHVAFTAPSRRIVDEFYRAALRAGGRDNGAPGLRPHYHANYYGAFVLDPDGHNIESVCHLPA
jgi:catechol 2,3-dioxygenase-like lactoylglutathione lyase family enzyme